MAIRQKSVVTTRLLKDLLFDRWRRSMSTMSYRGPNAPSPWDFPAFNNPYVQFSHVPQSTATAGTSINEAKIMHVTLGHRAELYSEVALHGCNVVCGAIVGSENILALSHISVGTEYANPSDDPPSNSAVFLQHIGNLARKDRRLIAAKFAAVTLDPAIWDAGWARALHDELQQLTDELAGQPNIDAALFDYPRTAPGFAVGVSLSRESESSIVLDQRNYTTMINTPPAGTRVVLL